jgi:hypothetical protein
MMSFKEKNRGSIILFSVLIVTVVLTASLSAIAILIPKIKLVRDTGNSMGAVFAADSAIEWCIYESRNGDIDGPIMSNAAEYEITRGGDCENQELDHSVRGTYNDVSRAFDIGGV